MRNDKMAIRKKLVRLIPRAQLEDIAVGLGNNSPWHSDRATLEVIVVEAWSEEAQEIIERLVKQAKPTLEEL